MLNLCAREFHKLSLVRRTNDMDKLGKKDEGKSIYRIPPYYYLHVLDQNTNVTKVCAAYPAAMSAR